jgi:hypothetical protein
VAVNSHPSWTKYGENIPFYSLHTETGDEAKMFAFYEGNVRAGVQYVLETAGSKFLRTARKCRIETVDGNSSENE